MEIRDTTAFCLDRVLISASGGGILVEASTGAVSECTVEDAKGSWIVISFGARVT